MARTSFAGRGARATGDIFCATAHGSISATEALGSIPATVAVEKICSALRLLKDPLDDLLIVALYPNPSRLHRKQRRYCSAEWTRYSSPSNFTVSRSMIPSVSFSAIRGNPEFPVM
jgi:hypothetical protein